MTAAEHRDAALQLLADAETCDAPSEARVLTQSAIARALLRLLEIQLASGPKVVNVYNSSMEGNH